MLGIPGLRVLPPDAQWGAGPRFPLTAGVKPGSWLGILVLKGDHGGQEGEWKMGQSLLGALWGTLMMAQGSGEGVGESQDQGWSPVVETGQGLAAGTLPGLGALSFSLGR